MGDMQSRSRNQQWYPGYGPGNGYYYPVRHGPSNGNGGYSGFYPPNVGSSQGNNQYRPNHYYQQNPYQSQYGNWNNPYQYQQNPYQSQYGNWGNPYQYQQYPYQSQYGNWGNPYQYQQNPYQSQYGNWGNPYQYQQNPYQSRYGNWGKPYQSKQNPYQSQYGNGGNPYQYQQNPYQSRYPTWQQYGPPTGAYGSANPDWPREAAVIRTMIGHSIREYDPRVPETLGCARFVSEALHRATGLPIADAGVDALEADLRRFHYVPVPLSQVQPDDVIIAHRHPGQPGHAAIYVGNGMVANNSSYQRRIAIDSVSKFNSRQYVSVVAYRRVG